MPKYTAKPIDPERNTKERLRNQSLQNVILAIGKEVGMEHLRKQDYLEEALRQLRAYHEMKVKEQTEQQYLQLTLEAVRHQLGQAQGEITRLRGMLNLVPQAPPMQVDFTAAKCHQVVPGNDLPVSPPSNCFNDGADEFMEAQPQPIQEELQMPQLPTDRQSIDRFQIDVDLERHESLTSWNCTDALPLASNGLQVAEELTLCNGEEIFGDSLTPAEVEMLKDFQEPDIDLLFGDTIDFVDLEEDAVPTSGRQLEERSDFPPSPSDPNYDINALLWDTQYS